MSPTATPVQGRVERPRRRQRVGQGRPRAAQPDQQAGDLDRPALDLGALRYLTAAQAVEHLNFKSLDALYLAVKSAAIPAWTYKRIGRTYRFLRVALDEWMESEYREHLRRSHRKGA